MAVPSFDALPSYQLLTLGDGAMGTTPDWPARIWAEATAPRTLALSQDPATQRRVAKLSSSGGSVAEAALPAAATAPTPAVPKAGSVVAQWYAHVQSLASMGLIHSIPSLLRTPHTPLTQVEELDPDVEAALVHFAEWMKHRGGGSK